MTATKPRTPPAAKSSESNTQTPTNAEGVEVEDFGLEFDPPSPSADTASQNPSAPPNESESESASAPVTWHLAQKDGHQEGPLLTDEIRRRLADGSLSSDSLIWGPGMPKWEPVNSVSEFQATALSPADTWLDPKTVEFIGNALAIAAVSIFVVSLIGGYWGYSWFTGALLFLLGSLMCEGFESVLAAIGRIESQIRTLEKDGHTHD